MSNQCYLCAIELFQSGICSKCQKNPPIFRRCIAPLSYQQPLNKSIVKIKKDAYAPELNQLSWLLADKVCESYKSEEIPEVLIPMPLHWLKIVRRGFNQSQLIANTLATKLPNSKVHNGICYRKKYRTDQHLRTRQQRWHSMVGAFSVRHNSLLKNSRVALIDDVITTGASATAAATCLLQEGAKSVDVWCIARTGWHNTAS